MLGARARAMQVSFACFAALGVAFGHPTVGNVWSTRPADPDAALTVVVAVQQKNLDALEEHFHAVSDPISPRRGKYLSFQEVGELVRNPAATQAVKAWATAEEFDVVDESSFGEYVLIRGPVRRLGAALSTTFEHYRNGASEEHMACEELVIPEALRQHVSGILGAIHTPMQKFGNWGALSTIASGKGLPVPSGFYPLPGKFNGTMTPQKIKSFYNIDDDKGSENLTQDIFSDGQVYTLSDLKAFRNQFNLNTDSTPENVGKMVRDTCPTCNATHDNWLQCSAGTGICGEASLDVQYLTAVSQVTHTRVHNINYDINYRGIAHALVAWIMDASKRSDSDLALVHSISYGIAEANLKDHGLFTAFNHEAMKLGSRGVSIFVASGDGGVCDGHGYSQCVYRPVFPASSPYVTAVGGTMGPESDLPERVMNIGDSGSFTAGSGFSERFPIPSWQKQAVSGYLQSDVGKRLVPGFNASNRAYPDVAFASNNFAVVIGGNLFPMMGGTSAAAPSLAGLFSLVNARRKAQGMGGVGFVNPTLYAAGSQGCCNDITEGSTMCSRKPSTFYPCAGACAPRGQAGSYAAYTECMNACLDNSCQAGFVATEGWDAASGLGSPDFQKLLKLFGVNGAAVIV